ncbi:MAG: MATE family efflux transporter [Sphingobacteriales bacterium 50-39]|nr:MATE family efflux transporter [Sphingobacteriales bacterium]OJW57399.1 MAG: MATE family efflux transporter [Sphingobacteriales bacterium 50-39]
MSNDQTTSSKTGANNNSVYSIIKQALSGEHRDYTTGSIRRAVIFLSIPMILEMCMESVFAVVDIFFVGRIGSHAVATVGLTESVLTIVYSMAIGLSMAATALVARRTGEKDPEGAAHAGAQAINLALGVTVVVSLVGAFFAGDILRVMGASPETVASGASYTRILFGGSVVIMLLYLINGVFRGAGNASMAMWSLWIANGCNIILCPILIHYFGLKGAAIATTIGRGVGVLYQLYHLFKGKGLIRMSWKSFTPDVPVLRSLIKVAWTGTMQFLIGSASWIVMVRITAKFGDAAIAGYQVAIRIFLFFLLPAWGMSNAAATLVGQNLGAQKPDRAEQSVWTAARYNGIFMLVVTLLFLFGSESIVSFMNKDAAVGKVAVLALRVVSLGYIIYGVGMVLTNAFNGAGDTRTPTLINLCCFWAFQIPLAYILAVVLDMGPLGLFVAIPITETAVTASSYLLFRKGAWKKVKI